MHTGLILIVLVSLVVPAGDTSQGHLKSYRVGQITRVLTGHSFECKLSNYQPSRAVRFRVSLRDIDVSVGNGSEKEALADLLAAAERVELRNVKFRNYFRVEADLFLDGEKFVSKKSPEGIPQPVENQSILSKKTVKSPRIMQQPNFPPRTKVVTKPSGPIHAVILSDLLDTPIDSSMLGPDTPLGEALEILSEAVNKRLPLVVLWSDLQTNAMVDKDTPIGISVPSRLTVRLALNSILRSIGISRGVKLVLVAEGNVLTLGTEQTLLKKEKTQVFSIEDLLQVPSAPVRY